MTGVNTLGDNGLMEALHERLRYARKMAGHPSARSAAIRFGWSPSTYAAHENGQNSFDAEVALKYATAFKTDPSWLLLGPVGRVEDESAGFVFRLVGNIREKDKVEYFPNRASSKLNTLILFTAIPGKYFLFSVSDSSLWPRYDEGDIIVLKPVDFSIDFAEYKEKDAIVTFKDRPDVFRQVHGTDVEGVYDLIGFNSPPIRNVEIQPSLVVTAIIKKTGYQMKEGANIGYHPGSPAS